MPQEGILGMGMLRMALRRIEPSLISLYRHVVEPPPPNLKGDRDIEYSWIAAHMPSGPGRALDVGSGTSFMALIAARRGFDTEAVDLHPANWPYAHPNLHFRQAEMLTIGAALGSFDLIICCSAIEHVGLGRYGDRPNPDGDLEAMKILWKLLRPSGRMLLTIPVGLDGTFGALHRVYGPRRLPRLLEGFAIERREFWLKDDTNRWIPGEEDSALRSPAGPSLYSIGCFMLRVAQ
ncbi:MAG: hypothetical protein A2V88_07700 [Elusimicrobia bacterium RBG_16_66_12]|nr:MAG: hypothetical protein A2V88_07700 [Elusimicrobia bacterium RBG_16_66_12]